MAFEWPRRLGPNGRGCKSTSPMSTKPQTPCGAQEGNFCLRVSGLDRTPCEDLASPRLVEHLPNNRCPRQRILVLPTHFETHSARPTHWTIVWSRPNQQLSHPCFCLSRFVALKSQTKSPLLHFDRTTMNQHPCGLGPCGFVDSPPPSAVHVFLRFTTRHLA